MILNSKENYPLLSKILIIFSFILILHFWFFHGSSLGSDNKSFSKVREIEISGLKSTEAEVGFKEIKVNQNLLGLPISVAGERFEHGILAHAPSKIVFLNQGRFKYFKAKIGIDDEGGGRGEVRFLILLDGNLAFTSEVIRGGSPVSPLLLNIRKANKVELVVNELGKYDYDFSVWCEPEFLNQIPKEWSTASLSKPESKSELKLDENKLWDTGNKTFPNQKGLFLWNIIVAIVYIIILTFVILKRRSILSNILKLKKYLVRPEVYILLLSAILSFWIFIPFWKQGLPVGWDAGQHYLRCWLMKNLFLSNFKLDGWSPYWYLGIQQFLFYSPFVYILVSLLHFFTFQLLPLLICYKIFYFLIYFVLPFACYWLMRQFKVDPLPSSIAALGVPSFSAIHGLGIEGLFIPGLFAQGFGILIFCFALGSLRKLKDYGGKNVLLMGLVIGILFISHIITSLYFGFCLLIFIAFNIYSGDKKNLFRIFTALVLGILISLFALWPAFNFRDLRGPEIGWGDFNFINDILEGKYFGPSLLNIFSILGFIILFFLKEKETKIIAFLAILTYLVASWKLVLLDSGIFSDIFRQVYKTHTFPYLAIYFIMFLGIFLQFFINVFSYIFSISITLNGKKATNQILAIVIICLVLVVTYNSFKRLSFLKGYIKVDSDFSNSKRKSIIEGFQWLEQNTPQNIVVAFDDRWETFGEIGFNQFASQINLFANRYTLQGNQIEATCANNTEVGKKFAEWPPQKLFEKLTRYNVSYLYTWNDDSMRNLSQHPELFRLVYFNGISSIWQLINYDFYYISNNVKIIKFFFSPERIKWEVLNKEKNNRIIAAIAYHPKWKLYINGIQTKIDKTDDHLITFSLPESESLYAIDLRFEKTFFEIVFNIISFVTFFVILFLVIKL